MKLLLNNKEFRSIENTTMTAAYRKFIDLLGYETEEVKMYGGAFCIKNAKETIKSLSIIDENNNEISLEFMTMCLVTENVSDDIIHLDDGTVLYRKEFDIGDEYNKVLVTYHMGRDLITIETFNDNEENDMDEDEIELDYYYTPFLLVNKDIELRFADIDILSLTCEDELARAYRNDLDIYTDELEFVFGRNSALNRDAYIDKTGGLAAVHKHRLDLFNPDESLQERLLNYAVLRYQFKGNLLHRKSLIKHNDDIDMREITLCDFLIAAAQVIDSRKIDDENVLVITINTKNANVEIIYCNDETLYELGYTINSVWISLHDTKDKIFTSWREIEKTYV